MASTVGEAFGQERVTLDSARLLEGAGNEVLFLAERVVGKLPEGARVFELPPVADLHWLSRPSLVHDRVARAAVAIESLSPDIVHFVDQFDHRFMRGVAERYPSIFTSHTFSPTCPSSTRAVSPQGTCEKPGGWSCLWRHRAQGCLGFLSDDLRRAHAIENFVVRRNALREMGGAIAISRSVAESLRNNGFSPDRIHLVPNPVFPSEERELVRSHVSRPLLVASRLATHKGVATAIAAVAGARRTVDLRVCGEGPEKDSLVSLANRLGIAARVKFLGRVDHRQLRALMRESLALLQPNVGPEPFGMSVVEALAEGLPVLAANVAALNEIVEDGISGRLLPPGDARAWAEAIDRLVSDPLTQARYSQAARVASRRYAPEAHLEATLGAYRSAIGYFRHALQPMESLEAFA